MSGPGREHLDYDFHHGAGRTIDPHFFAWRVARLDPAPLPEARLKRWLLDPEVIVAGLDELDRLGAIEHASSTHAFHLGPVVEGLAPRLAAAAFDDLGVCAALAAHLGDYEIEPASSALASVRPSPAWCRRIAASGD